MNRGCLAIVADNYSPDLERDMKALIDRVILGCAERRLSRGQLEDAARFLGSVQERTALRSRCWQLKGRLMRLSGAPDAAVPLLVEAVRRPGSTVSTILELAFTLIQNRDFERARGILQSVLARHSENRVASTLLAHLFRAQGRMATAFKVLKQHRPGRVAGRYSRVLPPRPYLRWSRADLWQKALDDLNRTGPEWSDPAGMAGDRDLRDDLISFFDELVRRPGGRRAMAHGVALAIHSDAGWLIRQVRICAGALRLDVPRELPMFIARHGDRTDAGLLLAGLAEGGRTRILSAAALISLGFDEFEEVLLEERSAGRDDEPTSDAWHLADTLLAAARG